jgi:hypothetical protein
MLKLSCSYDSVRFLFVKTWAEWDITVTFCVIFPFLTMYNTILGPGAVGAGAALRYGSGSNQMMQRNVCVYLVRKKMKQNWPIQYLLFNRVSEDCKTGKYLLYETKLFEYQRNETKLDEM